MKNQLQRRVAASGLFLALLASLVWPRSMIAQQLRHSPATVNLGQAINLLFVDLQPAFSWSDKLPLTPGIKHGQTDAPMKSLPCGKEKLGYESFARPVRSGPANAALLRNPVPTRLIQIEGSSTPMATDRFEVSHVSLAESERWQHLLALYQEDTPFSTQVRMPVADLWRGRSQLDAFYREISAHSMFHGLSQSSSVWWASPGSLTLRPAVSFGIRLSLRMPQIRPRTLYGYLVGGRG